MTLAIRANFSANDEQNNSEDTLARLEQLESQLAQRARWCSENNYHKQMLVCRTRAFA